MTGIPAVLGTRQDWLNIYEYARASNDAELKKQFRRKLAALRDSRHMKVLREGISADAEEQIPDDFEDALDPASPFVQSGLAEEEIDQMIGVLNA